MTIKPWPLNMINLLLEHRRATTSLSYYTEDKICINSQYHTKGDKRGWFCCCCFNKIEFMLSECQDLASAQWLNLLPLACLPLNPPSLSTPKYCDQYLQENLLPFVNSLASCIYCQLTPSTKHPINLYSKWHDNHQTMRSKNLSISKKLWGYFNWTWVKVSDTIQK